MSRLRFTAASEVFKAFPSAQTDVGAGDQPDDEPVRYMTRLAQSATPDAAVAFCAYVLPRREAVWWGCRSFRLLFPESATAPPEGLLTAEAWVRRPEDGLRRAALELGMSGDLTTVPPWLALGAGWAGGSMAPGEHAVQAPPHLTAKAMNASLLLGLGLVPPARRATAIRDVVAIGSRLAEGSETI